MTSIELDLKQGGYDEARGRVFYRRLLDAVRADGGVESAALAAYKPAELHSTRERSASRSRAMTRAATKI